jgi:hypothetical protein
MESAKFALLAEADPTLRPSRASKTMVWLCGSRPISSPGELLHDHTASDDHSNVVGSTSGIF